MARLTRPMMRWWGSGLPHQRSALSPGIRMADDRGMVIAEAAVVIPVMVVLALVLAWGVSVTADVMTLADAARQAARDIARGVSVGDAVVEAQRRAPEAEISIGESGDLVTVTVREDVAPPFPALDGFRLPLSQSVSVPREWQ